MAVKEYYQMIAALKAEEALRMVTIIAAGNGLIPKGEREVILNAWRRLARMGGERRRQTLADLSAPGLPIVWR